MNGYLVIPVSVYNSNCVAGAINYNTCMCAYCFAGTRKKDISNFRSIRTIIAGAIFKNLLPDKSIHSFCARRILRNYRSRNIDLTCTPAYEHGTPCSRINTVPRSILCIVCRSFIGSEGIQISIRRFFFITDLSPSCIY